MVRILTFVLLLSLLPAVPFDAQGQDSTAARRSKKSRFELTDGTLRDKLTNLEWSRRAHTDLGTFSWSSALQFVENLNRDRHLGHSDWRLPIREELLSLVDLATKAGKNGSGSTRSIAARLVDLGLRNVKNEPYWSATEYWYNKGMAWTVDLGNGNMVAREKELYQNVITVRSFR